MYQTYKNFKELATLHMEDTNPCTLAQTYQQTEDPVLLAVVFCNQFPYILTQVGKYFYLTDEDKSSFAVEELHKAMLDFNPSKGAKVTTLFSRYLNNRLRAETQMLNHQKRSANNGADCYESTAQLFEGVEDNRFEDLEFYQSLKQSGLLTENELQYCKIVMHDTVHIKDVDVAERLSISSSAVSQMKKTLSKKLSTFAF